MYIYKHVKHRRRNRIYKFYGTLKMPKFQVMPEEIVVIIVERNEMNQIVGKYRFKSTSRMKNIWL